MLLLDKAGADYPPRAIWPGALEDVDVIVDFQAETTPNDVVTVIATEPLTDNENWTRYEPGQWSLWRRGECVSQGVTE